MKHTAAPLTRGRRLAIRVVGAIGVLLFAFFSIVALNVLGVVASRTTMTRSCSNATSVTLTPGRASSMLNAVVTRTGV